MCVLSLGLTVCSAVLLLVIWLLLFFLKHCIRALSRTSCFSLYNARTTQLAAPFSYSVHTAKTKNVPLSAHGGSLLRPSSCSVTRSPATPERCCVGGLVAWGFNRVTALAGSLPCPPVSVAIASALLLYRPSNEIAPLLPQMRSYTRCLFQPFSLSTCRLSFSMAVCCPAQRVARLLCRLAHSTDKNHTDSVLLRSCLRQFVSPVTSSSVGCVTFPVCSSVSAHYRTGSSSMT